MQERYLVRRGPSPSVGWNHHRKGTCAVKLVSLEVGPEVALMLRQLPVSQTPVAILLGNPYQTPQKGGRSHLGQLPVSRMCDTTSYFNICRTGADSGHETTIFSRLQVR